MGKYKKGEHVKIEVKDENSPIGELMWMLVEDSDDERQLVFGRLTMSLSQPLIWCSGSSWLSATTRSDSTSEPLILIRHGSMRTITTSILYNQICTAQK